MRIVFLAVDDEFAGSMQRPLYESRADWVVGSVISTRAVYKKSNFGAMIFVVRSSGLRYSAEMFRMKMMRKLTASNTNEEKVKPSELARRHQVESFRCGNINDAESLNRLRAWEPDLIISTNFSHYIGNHVRSIPRVGTWNLHKSHLPHYRGMNPSFYALLHGEKHAGVTLHKVAKGFDTGDIIKQVSVPIAPDDTVYSLNQKTSQAGGRMMAELLTQTPLEQILATPQPQGDWPNYTYPTRAHVRAFLEKGLRF